MIPQIQRRASNVAIALALSFPLATEASPRITSVDGDIQEGGSITISGSGFTSLNTDQVTYDHVSNQTEYSSLSSGSDVPVDNGPWTQDTNQWGNPVTIEKSGDLRTDKSAAIYYGEVKSYLGYPRSLEGAGNQKLYASWWFKPNQRADSGGSNKFARIWDRSDGEGTRISWTQMHMTYSGQSGGSETSWGTTQPAENQWNKLEILVDSSKNKITAWLNGQVTQDVSNFRKASTSEGLSLALVGFDPSIANNYGNYAFRMTDIYVAPTPARVELSDSATWSPTSRREVLTPLSWSDGTISVKLNYLSLDPSESLYVYVFDEDGNVTPSGFPLCEKCPNKPQGVSIE
ncbi:hypothetical protein [Marinobacter similis]|uniref:hypothetical protein n=1 Tax=Marinobacter similis TaxID=1420916 RepID=UPI000AE1A250|nr:hypothetical protein [Marinobacter similis]